jgi:hypothetical protein
MASASGHGTHCSWTRHRPWNLCEAPASPDGAPRLHQSRHPDRLRCSRRRSHGLDSSGPGVLDSLQPFNPPISFTWWIPTGGEPSRSARRGQIVARRFVESTAPAARRSASRGRRRYSVPAHRSAGRFRSLVLPLMTTQRPLGTADRSPTARSVENLELVSAQGAMGSHPARCASELGGVRHTAPPDVRAAGSGYTSAGIGGAGESAAWRAAAPSRCASCREIASYWNVRARLASSAIGPGATRSGRRVRRAIARRDAASTAARAEDLRACGRRRGFSSPPSPEHVSPTVRTTAMPFRRGAGSSSAIALPAARSP